VYPQRSSAGRACSLNRLGRLENLAGGGLEETEAERRLIREGAEGANDRARREGRVVPFEIAANGAVSCTHDGRPVTAYRQTVAEVWYREELEEGGPGHLLHDIEAEAFHTHSGELALSRDLVDLRYLMPR
jgi:hypothetical protein